MSYNGNYSGIPAGNWPDPSAPALSPPPPVQSAADVVRKAIAKAKGEITGQPVMEEIKSPVARVLEGLNTLCEVSNGAFSYTVERQTSKKLKVITELGGRTRTIRLNGWDASLGRGIFRGHMTPEMMLGEVAQKAVKRGFVP